MINMIKPYLKDKTFYFEYPLYCPSKAHRLYKALNNNYINAFSHTQKTMVLKKHLGTKCAP